MQLQFSNTFSFFFAAAVRPIFWSVPHFGHVFRSHLVGSLGHGRWKLMSGPQTCMEVYGRFFLNGRSGFMGHDDSMHLQLGLNGKYMSMLFYRKIYLYHPSPSFTYYLSSLSIYILYHTLSTIYTIILFIIILYLLFDTRQNRKHHIVGKG